MRAIEKKPSFTEKCRIRREQMERVWKEHPEAMVQLIGGVLIFTGTIISVGAKVATMDWNTEKFYITDGNDTYSIKANKERTLC